MPPVSMRRISLALLTMAFLSSCAPATPPAENPDATPPPQEQQQVPQQGLRTQLLMIVSPSGENVAVNAEIADTTDARTQGLMFREELADDTGMLFVFGEPQSLIFWMKNTLIPLDVLFFDASGAFISASTMEPCAADPCTTYASASPAQYALEVPAGFAQKHSVGEGWKLLLQ